MYNGSLVSLSYRVCCDDLVDDLRSLWTSKPLSQGNGIFSVSKDGLTE